MAKILVRNFFLQAEMLSNRTILHLNRSPLTCYDAVSDMNKYPEFVQ